MESTVLDYAIEKMRYRAAGVNSGQLIMCHEAEALVNEIDRLRSKVTDLQQFHDWALPQLKHDAGCQFHAHNEPQECNCERV